MDGRSHALSLTPRGRAITNQIRKIVAEHEATLLDKIPASARSAFLESLRAIWKGE
jgi:DNA-binding MarR family transcriptional regulator